jgi:cyclopropane fatty-acyl-phospholipid synthase-like methyltransferase
MVDSKEYWEGYYKNNPDPFGESQFARFVAGFLNQGESLYELGCGNGRDSMFFGKKGVEVVAFDQCENEIGYLESKNEMPNLHFESGDFTNLGNRTKVNHIYSRFTLHSVSEDKEVDTLAWAYNHLLSRGFLFVEIRGVNDDLYGKGEKVGIDEFVTSHYRRFVVFEDFVQRIQRAGFEVIYKIESKGLAPHGDDDPAVIRVVGRRE